MWLTKDINLGVITPDEVYTVVFSFKNECEFKVKELKGSCGCLSVKWNSSNKTVVVKYKAPKIPHHLKQVGQFNTVKMVKINYFCAGEEFDDVLYIRGIVKKTN